MTEPIEYILLWWAIILCQQIVYLVNWKLLARVTLQIIIKPMELWVLRFIVSKNLQNELNRGEKNYRSGIGVFEA